MKKRKEEPSPLCWKAMKEKGKKERKTTVKSQTRSYVINKCQNRYFIHQCFTVHCPRSDARSIWEYNNVQYNISRNLIDVSHSFCIYKFHQWSKPPRSIRWSSFATDISYTKKSPAMYYKSFLLNYECDVYQYMR